MKISRKISFASIVTFLLGIGIASMSASSDKPESKESKAPQIMKRTEVVEKTGAATQKKADKKKDHVRGVEVTGSRIQVKNATSKEILHGQSQVQVIDQNRIRQSGRADLLGVLSNLPGVR